MFWQFQGRISTPTLIKLMCPLLKLIDKWVEKDLSKKHICVALQSDEIENKEIQDDSWKNINIFSKNPFSNYRMTTQKEVLLKMDQLSKEKLNRAMSPDYNRQKTTVLEPNRKGRSKYRVGRKRTATIKEKDEVIYSNSPSKSPSKCFSIGNYSYWLSENNVSDCEEEHRESNSTCEDQKSSKLSPILSPKKPHSSQNSPICLLSLKSCPQQPN